MVAFTQMPLDEMELLIQMRAGEEKWGSLFWIPEHDSIQESIIHFKGKALLLGIPEDVGVRANGGIGGAHTAWLTTLKYLVNMQANRFNPTTQLGILGSFKFEEKEKKGEALHNLVEEIDEAVFPIIQAIVQAGKIPIIIGGGHNNAYPIIKGVSKALMSPVNVINIDAHADMRESGDRHSGNGFTYAKEEGYLQRYFVLGLHENYNGENMLRRMENDRQVSYLTYESIAIRGDYTPEQAIENAISFTQSQTVGLELDVDAISGMLSSAGSAVGFSILEIRKMLFMLLKKIRPVYVHICEAATELENGRKDSLNAKTLAYLVSDIIKAIN